MTVRLNLPARLAEKEAELAAARAALDAYSSVQHVGGSAKRKSFGVRVDADIRRTARMCEAIRRIENEIAVLRRKSAQELARAQRAPVDLARLPYATAVRTDGGWYRVVKVNRKTVKVVMPPGMGDLIQISRIVAIHERPIIEEAK